MRYLIVCIGNPNGGDDAVGPYIAEKMSSEMKDKTFDGEILDVGIVPENFTGVIKEKNPETLILIDAVDMNLSPGEIRIIPPDSIGVMHVSTHGIPLSVYIQYLHQYIKKITLIGVQPERMHGEMSASVIKSSHQLISMILDDDIDSIEILKN
jgi:hydrogenase 3 maturation protease